MIHRIYNACRIHQVPFLLALLSMLICRIFEIFYSIEPSLWEHFAPAAIRLSNADVSQATNEFAARVALQFMEMVLDIVSVLTIAVCVQAIWQSKGRQHGRWLILRRVFICGIPFLMFFAFNWLGERLPEDPAYIFAVKVFGDFIESNGQMFGKVASCLSYIEFWIRPIAIFAIITAISAVMTPIDRNEYSSDELKTLASFLSRLVSLGAVILVVDVMQTGLWFNWVSSQGAVADVRAALWQIGRVSMLITGGQFTLLLVVLYIPSAMVLTARVRQRITESFSEHVDKKALVAQMDELGLDVSTFGYIKKSLTMVAPILAPIPLIELMTLLLQ